MKQIQRIVCSAAATAFLFSYSYAGAANTEVIQENIEQAKERQAQAHEIAEYVRTFGENDTHPAILFAREKWSEQEELLSILYEQYEQAAKEEQEEQERKEQEQQKGVYLGRFRISHYCPCVSCNGNTSRTATGTALSPWYTAAVDSSVIPLRSMLYIDGYGTFQAQDTGGAIRGNRIDVCVESHAEAMRLGVVYRDVYLQS